MIKWKKKKKGGIPIKIPKLNLSKTEKKLEPFLEAPERSIYKEPELMMEQNSKHSSGKKLSKSKSQDSLYTDIKNSSLPKSFKSSKSDYGEFETPRKKVEINEDLEMEQLYEKPQNYEQMLRSIYTIEFLDDDKYNNLLENYNNTFVNYYGDNYPIYKMMAVSELKNQIEMGNRYNILPKEDFEKKAYNGMIIIRNNLQRYDIANSDNEKMKILLNSHKSFSYELYIKFIDQLALIFLNTTRDKNILKYRSDNVNNTNNVYEKLFESNYTINIPISSKPDDNSCVYINDSEIKNVDTEQKLLKSIFTYRFKTQLEFEEFINYNEADFKNSDVIRNETIKALTIRKIIMELLNQIPGGLTIKNMNYKYFQNHYRNAAELLSKNLQLNSNQKNYHFTIEKYITLINYIYKMSKQREKFTPNIYNDNLLFKGVGYEKINEPGNKYGKGLKKRKINNNKINILQGQILAGNDNKQIKNELKKLIRLKLKQKK